MKGAIQLSVNFLVTLLIALVIFGFGISFIYSLVTDADNFFELTQEQIDTEIDDLRCAGTDKVCVPRTSIEVSEERPGFASVRITNIYDVTTTFPIVVEPSGFTTDDGTFVTADDATYPADAIDIRFERGEKRIDATQTSSHGIAFIANEDAPRGIYQMRIHVYNQVVAPSQRYDSKVVSLRVR